MPRLGGLKLGGTRDVACYRKHANHHGAMGLRAAGRALVVFVGRFVGHFVGHPHPATRSSSEGVGER